MKNILGYLKKHKLIIIALGIVLIISLILILTLGNKIGNEPKVIENLSCSALNDIKTIIPKNVWSDTALIITNNGDLYTLNEKKYSDETNCKQINGDIKVTGYLITDMSGLFIFGTDESYKYNNDTNQLTLEENIEKFSVIAANGWFSPYYNLKEDGIIYQWKTYDTTTGTFSEEKEFLKFDNEKILDFGIANSEINYIRTDKAYYTRKLANEQECTEYADVECKYELYKDNYLTENYDKVAGIIEENVIFKNGDIVDYDIENMHRLDEKLEISQNQENDAESEIIEEEQDNNQEQEDNNTTSDRPSNNVTKPNTNNSNQNNNTNTSNDTTKPNTSNDIQNNNQANDTGNNQNDSNTQDISTDNTTTEETEQKEFIKIKSVDMENNGGTFKIGDTITWHVVIESEYPLLNVGLFYKSSVNFSPMGVSTYITTLSDNNEYNITLTKIIDETMIPGKWEFYSVSAIDKYNYSIAKVAYDLNYNSSFIVTE